MSATSDQDQSSGPANGRRNRWEPQSVSDLEAEFPGWHAWLGVNNLWYVRKTMSSAPVVMRGESLTDLRDQIIVWLRNHTLI